MAFSGGKAIGGPQASGILVGRRDLIQSAALQQLDHDTYFEQWNPPAVLFDKQQAGGASGERRRPRREVRQGGDRRPAHGAEALPGGQFRGTSRALARPLRGNRGRPAGRAAARAVALVSRKYRGAPAVELAHPTKTSSASPRSISSSAFRTASRRSTPITPRARRHRVFGPTCLRGGDTAVVIARVRAELGSRAANRLTKAYRLSPAPQDFLPASPEAPAWPVRPPRRPPLRARPVSRLGVSRRDLLLAKVGEHPPGLALQWAAVAAAAREADPQHVILADRGQELAREVLLGPFARTTSASEGAPGRPPAGHRQGARAGPSVSATPRDRA